MNKKTLVIYYMAVLAAFVTTQAPFWVARKATAAETTQVKRACKAPKATNAIKKSAKALKAPKMAKSVQKTKTVPVKMVTASTHLKPYKAISSSLCTYDPERKMLICQHGEGINLELPVIVKPFVGNPLEYVARLPKSKNALCGLPVPKKGEKLGEGRMGAAQQCGLVIDESRINEAVIAMPDKLKSLKLTDTKTVVAQAETTPVTQ